MKKRNVYLLFLIIGVFVLCGCNLKKETQKVKIDIPKRGDYIDYSEVLSVKDYKTQESITGGEESQTYKTDTSLEWIVISNENGLIRAIANKNIVDTSGKGLGFNKETAYISGPGVLNVLCNTLYSTKYGTVRSVKVNDIVDLIHNKSSNKIEKNKDFYKFTKGKFYSNGVFKEATEKNSITVKSKYYSYYLKNEIDLEEIVAKEALNNESTTNYYNKYHYWLADSGIEVHKDNNNPYVVYGIQKMTGDQIILHNIVKQSEKETSYQDTYYLGVRPIVEIKTNIKLKKEESKSKRIWTIMK